MIKKIITIGLLPFFAGPALAAKAPSGKPFVAINDQIVEVKGSIISLQEQISSLVDRMGTLEGSIDSYSSAIERLENENLILTTLIEQNATSITDIQTLINDLSWESNQIKQALQDQSGDIESLTLQLEENEQLITTLQSSLMTEISNQSTLFDGQISTLQAQISNNEQLITALQNDLDELNSALTLKQNVINGVCPDGMAVVSVDQAGSLTCEVVGGNPADSYSIIAYSYINENYIPSGSENYSPSDYSQSYAAAARCPTGYRVSEYEFRKWYDFPLTSTRPIIEAGQYVGRWVTVWVPDNYTTASNPSSLRVQVYCTPI